MRRKKDIDGEVARLLDLRPDLVAMVTGCFLRTALHEIVDNGELLLDTFGTFRLKEQKNVVLAYLVKGTGKKGERRGDMPVKVRRKFRVWFKKSAKFREAIEEACGKEKNMSDKTDDKDGMDKYAVDEGFDQEVFEKRAAGGCPWCGEKLTRQGTVLLCPRHGTEPFEREGK